MLRAHDRSHLRELAAVAALDRFAREREGFRAELDELCRIPSVSEARKFLGDRRPDRRQRLIED